MGIGSDAGFGLVSGIWGLGTHLAVSHPYMNRTFLDLSTPRGCCCKHRMPYAEARSGRRSCELKRIQGALCKVEGEGVVLVLHHAIPRKDAWREVSLGVKGIP